MHASRPPAAAVTFALLAASAVTATAQAAPSCSGKKWRSTESVYSASNAKFKAVIDNTRTMQHPGTSTCLSQREMKDGTILDDGDTDFRVTSGRLRFDFRGGSDGNRMELRGNDFSVFSSGKQWKASFRFPNREGSNGYTVGQIFGFKDGAYSKPIVRIAYKERLKGTDGVWRDDHLWAIYREGTGDSSSVRNYDLGPAPTSSLTGTVTATFRPGGRNEITVSYSRSGTSYGTTTIPLGSVWRTSNARVYHKAGCYLQDPGDCRVDFTSLFFAD